MSVPQVLAGLRAAERDAGRPAGSARLVAVTKGHTLDEIGAQILPHGPFPLGESRGQELRDKSTQRPELEWHFIGPLQRNKIKYLGRVALIHTIEAVWQAEAIAQAAQGWGHAPDVLIQLHNGEVQKHGVPPHDLPATLAAVQATGLQVRGVMVIAPDERAGADPAGILRVFQETAARAHDLGLPELSMGMSADYPLAVQAGATLIRVGRSLFT
ncbi:MULTISPECIES: YggS family pyridoxal phosphate enzyme [Deinococcus]|uniref:YggS family pyridoxal phosphate enzyme n=1 Tax=Deinococcus rufus TaxID=2136097 RepID=A0ABV7ZC81_9DEIO|nr:alanine racemase [Deinococcus sp. AB2017081]WQE94182.1 alanine racemase [Deinococcus sp. AB2017081]